MGLNFNPNDKFDERPSNTTYHQRGKDEGISLEEFKHRYSIYLNNKGNRDYVNHELLYCDPHGDIATASLDGHSNRSLFDTVVTDSALGNLESIFNSIDKDHDGMISLEEFNNVGATSKKFFEAYDINKVPNNPKVETKQIIDNILGKNDKLSPEEKKEFGL